MEQERECHLYLVSPPQIILPEFTEQVKAAFDGGHVGSFQLRLKGASDSDILRAAEAIIPICHQHGAAFIMNDSPELAVRAGADGVHIGQDDGSVAAARKVVGKDRVIGVSCHDSRHMAMDAGEEGADYVAFGAFYPTKSKSAEALARYGVPTPDILEWWQTFIVLPCVAIGGITPENCGALVSAGADFIAAITAVWSHTQGPKAAVKAFNEAIGKAL